MSATIYERLACFGDYLNDNGPLDITYFHSLMDLYSSGLVTATWLKVELGLTTAQGNDLDDILATMPSTLLTLLGALDRARWPGRVCGILRLALSGNDDYDSVPEIKAALGV